MDFTMVLGPVNSFGGFKAKLFENDEDPDGFYDGFRSCLGLSRQNFLKTDQDPDGSYDGSRSCFWYFPFGNYIIFSAHLKMCFHRDESHGGERLVSLSLFSK